MHTMNRKHILKLALISTFCMSFDLAIARADRFQCMDLFRAKAFAGVDMDVVERMKARRRTPEQRVIQTMVTSQGLAKFRADRGMLEDHTTYYSFTLPEKPVRGNQGQTGSCFITAVETAIEEVHLSKGQLLPDQTLSRPYILFFDYLEKVGKHIDQLIALRQQNDRLKNSTILKTIEPKIADGGYAESVLFDIEKYGVVLNSAMPDRANSLASAAMLADINTYVFNKSYELWNFAEKFDKKAKALHARTLRGETTVDLEKLNEEQMKILQAKKNEIVEGVYAILEVTLGPLPVSFKAQLPVKDPKTGKMTTEVQEFTPREFATDYLKIDRSEWVNVSNLRNLPRGKAYQVKYQDMNVPIRKLNLTPRRMKILVKKSLLANIRVPFDSNFGPGVNRTTGDMQIGTDSTKGVYPFNRDQAPRALSPSEMAMLNLTEANHETVFTGFDLQKGANVPSAFKVENSWGSGIADDGNFKMLGAWFDLEVDGIMIHRSMLTEKELAQWDANPVILPADNE